MRIAASSAIDPAVTATVMDALALHGALVTTELTGDVSLTVILLPPGEAPVGLARFRQDREARRDSLDGRFRRRPRGCPVRGHPRRAATSGCDRGRNPGISHLPDNRLGRLACVSYCADEWSIARDAGRRIAAIQYDGLPPLDGVPCLEPLDNLEVLFDRLDEHAEVAMAQVRLDEARLKQVKQPSYLGGLLGQPERLADAHLLATAGSGA